MCMCLCDLMSITCMQEPEKARRGIPGVGVTDSYEPPCGWWDWNSGPLQEQ